MFSLPLPPLRFLNSFQSSTKQQDSSHPMPLQPLTCTLIYEYNGETTLEAAGSPGEHHFWLDRDLGAWAPCPVTATKWEECGHDPVADFCSDEFRCSETLCTPDPGLLDRPVRRGLTRSCYSEYPYCEFNYLIAASTARFLHNVCRRSLTRDDSNLYIFTVDPLEVAGQLITASQGGSGGDVDKTATAEPVLPVPGLSPTIGDILSTVTTMENAGSGSGSSLTTMTMIVPTGSSSVIVATNKTTNTSGNTTTTTPNRDALDQSSSSSGDKAMNNNNNNTTVIIVGAVLSSIAVISIVAVTIAFLRRRRRWKRHGQGKLTGVSSSPSSSSSPQSSGERNSRYTSPSGSGSGSLGIWRWLGPPRELPVDGDHNRPAELPVIIGVGNDAADHSNGHGRHGHHDHEAPLSPPPRLLIRNGNGRNNNITTTNNMPDWAPTRDGSCDI